MSARIVLPIIATCFAVCLALAANEVKAQSIAGNGSFETPATPDRTTFSAGQTIGAWTVGSGDVDLLSNWQAADGQQLLTLSGLQAGSVHQDLVLTSGQQYTLSFAMAGDPFQPGYPVTKSMQVLWGTTIVDTPTFNITGKSVLNMGWKTHTYQLMAPTGTVRLSFISLDNDNAGPALDHVRVTAVPEPQTYALLLAGLSLISLRAHSKRKHSLLRFGDA